MRGVRVDEAEVATRLPGLLDMVEQGQSVVIMRCGHPVAELVSSSRARETEEEKKAHRRAAVEALKEYRRTAPSLGNLSIKQMIEEGRM